MLLFMLPASADIDADAKENSLDAAARAAHQEAFPDSGKTQSGPEGGGGAKPPPPVYVTSRELGVDSRFECSDLHAESELWETMACGVSNQICQLADRASGDGEGYLASESVRIDTRSPQVQEELLGFDCQQRGGVPAAEGAEPVVITVTREDFESMPVEPLTASAGPEQGWLPVNMVNVLHADDQTQTMAMELLGTPVEVRAIPVQYDWDLGDGNSISTTDPGKPYPSEAVSATYRYEGWYDVTLTTTFSGQFSVGGGPWQDIDGTVQVASEPIPIFSKSLESRLVNGDVPVDEEEDPWIPERTEETEGKTDPDATHREI
ncbi:hypothetical protein [Brachybacterium sp.]|uniref:hypothetical protein n=1 Tax=Brachybacterium sp. TaxID=1891286 RepID=UPI002ED3AF2F